MGIFTHRSWKKLKCNWDCPKIFSERSKCFGKCKACVVIKIIVLLDVYSLCVAYPEPLADRLYGETKKFLEDHVTATLAKVKSGGEQSLLANYHSAWQEFSK